MSKSEVKKENYAKLDNLKFCPVCGRSAVIQQPQNMANNILSCGRCGVNFRMEII